jgi:uncharacterized repeat protein (TIGR01451 family)
VALAVLVAMFASLAAAATASAAPWACDASAYVTQFDAVSTSGNTLFQRADRQPDGSYDLTTLGQVNAAHVNALAFRPQDGFMYAVDNTNRRIVRIQDDGTGRPRFTSLAYPAAANSEAMVAGAILNDGTYMVWDNGGTRGALFDVSGAVPTLITNLTAADANVVGADFAINPIDGKLYTANTGGGLHQITVSGSMVTAGPSLGAAMTAGGQWFLPDGTMMLYDNVAGGGTGIFRADLATGALTEVGDAPTASNVDVASCANGLSLQKDVAPRTVNAGEDLTYTFTMTNRALQSGTVSFVDDLPAGLTYVAGGVTVTPTAFATPNDYAGTGRLAFSGTIAAGQTVTVTARVRVAPDHDCDVSASNQAQATLTVAGLPPVTVSSDDASTLDEPNDPTSVGITCSADLAVVKAPSASPAHPGQQLGYTLTVTNNGPSDARDVVVTDSLPAQLTFVSGDPRCNAVGQTVTCSVASLAPGATQAFALVTNVAASATGELENTAQVTSTTGDPNPGNNTSTSRVPVEPLADLSIAKSATAARAVPGRRLAYRLVVANTGPSAAVNVRVADSLPRGLTFVSASDGCSFASGKVTCTVDSLAAGAAQTFEVVTRVASSVTSAIQNTATVTSDTRDPDTSNNTSTARVPVGPEADLSITKLPSVDSALVGQQLFYTVVVRDNGPSDASGVTITDVAGAGLTLLSAQASQGSCTIAGSTLTCRLGAIADGGTAQVLVSARADAAGQLVNGATVAGNQPDPSPRNNRTTTTVPGRDVPVPPAVPEVPPVPTTPVPPVTTTPSVPEPADLAIVKHANRKTVAGSQQITYTITVTNRGPGTATGVVVIDTPSLPLRVRSIRASVGRCTTRVPLRCDLGTLSAGKSATIQVVAQPLAPGSLRNAASVTGDVPDPVASNNMGSATTKVRGKLTVSKTADHTTARVGGTVTYRIRAANPSGFAIRNVRICDTLPAGLVAIRSAPRARLSSGKRCWTVRQLGAHRSATFKLTVRVLNGSAGRRVNRVAASSPDAATVHATRAVTVVGGGVEGTRAGGVTG